MGTPHEGSIWRPIAPWANTLTMDTHTKIHINLDYGVKCEREREMFYLTAHSTHFIYSYMASDIWLRTILIVRKETCCRHIGYSFRLTARVLLYAPSHRQDNTYHYLCYTSRWSTGWNEKELNGSTPWRIDPTTHHTMSERSYHGHTYPDTYKPGLWCEMQCYGGLTWLDRNRSYHRHTYPDTYKPGLWCEMQCYGGLTWLDRNRSYHRHTYPDTYKPGLWCEMQCYGGLTWLDRNRSYHRHTYPDTYKPGLWCEMQCYGGLTWLDRNRSYHRHSYPDTYKPGLWCEMQCYGGLTWLDRNHSYHTLVPRYL